ncbi:MAG TPA: ribonuclease HII [Candidatus Deferrimicrobium sp.]|nr:ribonuclease HII [Candidatus Kapabacteria bacterium]HLP62236.1 ribonuclease HII [Candidatus Deferrimicrobium sp.]
MRNYCNYDIEERLQKKNYMHICGIDEVGRGAIFGPVVAGAVILDPGRLNYEINDSKKLDHHKRVELSEYIYENAPAYSIGWCWNDEIDECNILEATKKAIKMAVKGLQISPGYVLLDGMKPDFIGIAGEGIIKGDSQSLSIAAASIIAKVFRDQLLISFSQFYPDYSFQKNKGYATREHVQAVSMKGLTEFHRKSFDISGAWKYDEGAAELGDEMMGM